MAEEEWSIDTSDGKRIYGLINRSAKKNNKLILYIPGLGGDCMDYPAVRMAMIFPKQGYDVARINLYGWQEDARKLPDCTIKLHALDINLIIKHFKKKYKKVFATGHSYGGPCLMSSQINQLDAVSLWDPSYIPQISAPKNDFIISGKFNIAFDFLTMPVVVKKSFVTEASQFNRKHAITLSKM